MLVPRLTPLSQTSVAWNDPSKRSSTRSPDRNFGVRKLFRYQAVPPVTQPVFPAPALATASNGPTRNGGPPGEEGGTVASANGSVFSVGCSFQMAAGATHGAVVFGARGKSSMLQSCGRVTELHEV